MSSLEKSQFFNQVGEKVEEIMEMMQDNDLHDEETSELRELFERASSLTESYL